MRVKLRYSCSAPLIAGITPARAGKMDIWRLAGRDRYGSPPLVRVKFYDLLKPEIISRITPARAGKINCRSRTCLCG